MQYDWAPSFLGDLSTAFGVCFKKHVLLTVKNNCLLKCQSDLGDNKSGACGGVACLLETCEFTRNISFPANMFPLPFTRQSRLNKCGPRPTLVCRSGCFAFSAQREREAGSIIPKERREVDRAAVLIIN